MTNEYNRILKQCYPLGEKGLAVAILLTAFDDVKEGGGLNKSTAMLFFESGDFKIYSDGLGLSQSVVYNAYRSLVEKGSDQGLFSFFKED